MSGYELHQKLRTKTVRLIKKKQYDEAIEALYQGALSLFEQKEQGSACDLALYMIDVYGIKGQEVDSDSRDRVTEILGKAEPDFWRKKVFDAAIKWSSKSSDSTAGDPLLRLYIAKLLAKEKSYHLAESHFIFSCIPSPSTYTVENAPKAFAQMMLDWLIEHSQAATKVEGETRDANAIERIEAGRFALRGLVPLLVSRAISQARAFLGSYIQLTTSRQKSLLLPVSPNPRPYVPPGGGDLKSDIQLFLTASPDLNFSQMALALVIESNKIKSVNPNRAVPDWLRNAWTSLVRQYEREAPALQQEEGVRESIPSISASFFDIQPPRSQNNMLSDMMASLFGDSSAPNKNHQQQQQLPSSSGPPPSKPAQAGTVVTSAASAKADDLLDEEMD